VLDFFAQAQQLVGGVFGGAAGLDAAGLAGGVDPVFSVARLIPRSTPIEENEAPVVSS